MKDNQSFLIVVAAVLCSGYFFLQSEGLRSQMKQLETEYEGFKQGVIYSR